MSPRDGYQGEPEEGDRVSRRWTDDEIERLLAGQQVADASEVSEFVAALAAFTEIEIDPEVATAHIAAAVAAATEAGSHVAADAPTRGRVARLRRRLAFSGFLSSVAAKIILGTTVALATTAGAAAAGILPDPLQSVAADAASIVGIHLPDPDDALTVEPRTTVTTASGPITGTVPVPPSQSDDETGDDTAAPPTTLPPQGEDAPGDEEEFEVEAPLASLVGEHTWSGAACDGTGLTVTYQVTEQGEIVAIGTTPAAQISSDSHGFTAEFDDADVEIELQRSGDVWRLRQRADQSCDDGSEEDGGSDSQAPDDSNDETPEDSATNGDESSESTTDDNESSDDEIGDDGGSNGSSNDESGDGEDGTSDDEPDNGDNGHGSDGGGSHDDS